MASCPAGNMPDHFQGHEHYGYDYANITLVRDVPKAEKCHVSIAAGIESSGAKLGTT